MHVCVTEIIFELISEACWAYEFQLAAFTFPNLNHICCQILHIYLAITIREKFMNHIKLTGSVMNNFLNCERDPL